MKFFFFSFLILVALHSVAQIPIEEIRVQPNSKFYNTNDVMIHYPFIIFDHGKTDQYLNNQIRERIIGDSYQTDSTGKKLSLKEQLIAWTNDGLANLNYSVTLFRNDLLSIEFNMEGMGAYPTTWSNQINIDLRTKKVLAFEDIIEPNKVDELKKNLHQTKLKALEQNLEETKDDIDTSELKWVMEETQNCIEDDSIENFLFRDKSIEFIDECDFPHAIQALGPAYDLMYNYSEIRNYLKTEFLKRITE